MKEIKNLEELKKIELEIMEDIHKYCIKENIKYYITYGTLIGAMRHNGFIPWDDDIDIFMPREDYNRFINNYSSDNYKVVNSFTKPYYARSMSKVIDNRTCLIEPAYRHDDNIGVFVDIWPLDGLPSSEKKLIKHMKKVNFYQRLLTLCNYKIKYCDSFIKKIGCIMMKFCNQNRLIFKIEKLSSKYSFYSSDYCFCNSIKRAYETKWFSIPMLHKFENDNFYVPENYDDCLKKMYGDWRKLPPVEEQKPHHLMNVFWK